MTSDNLSWKERCIWLAGMSLVVLVAAVTLACVAKDNQVAAYLSFASALVSIVLAVVAITYTIVQGLQSHQNVGEMKRLVAEGHSIFERHAVSMEESSKVVADRTQALLAMMSVGGATGGIEENAETVAYQTELTLDLSYIRDGTLLCLYVLGVAWREGIRIDPEKCDKLFFEKRHLPNEIASWFTNGLLRGVADTFSMLLGPGSICLSPTVVEVCEYPEGVLESVRAECNRRIENEMLCIRTEHFKQIPDMIHEVQCD